MSYSRSFTVATKNEAKARIATEIDDVIATQPMHNNERDVVITAGKAVIDLLADDDTMQVQVSMSGSIGWNGEDMDRISGCDVSISAHLIGSGGGIA